MSTKNLKLEYREYKLQEDFPLLVMTPQISTAPAWVEEPKLHFHNCIEIGLMHGENHSLSFENHTYPLQPGDFFVLSPYSMHYVNHTDGTKSHCCDYLYFNPEILLQAFYPVAVPEEMHWYQNSQIPFLFSRERNPEIYSLLLLILETHRQRNTSPHLQQNILQGLVLAPDGKLNQSPVPACFRQQQPCPVLSRFRQQIPQPFLPAACPARTAHRICQSPDSSPSCKVLWTQPFRLPHQLHRTAWGISGFVPAGCPVKESLRAPLQHRAFRSGNFHGNRLFLPVLFLPLFSKLLSYLPRKLAGSKPCYSEKRNCPHFLYPLTKRSCFYEM